MSEAVITAQSLSRIRFLCEVVRGRAGTYSVSFYPWRILYLGFFLLITYRRPLRRTIFESGVRFLTEALTFISFSCFLKSVLQGSLLPGSGPGGDGLLALGVSLYYL